MYLDAADRLLLSESRTAQLLRLWGSCTKRAVWDLPCWRSSSRCSWRHWLYHSFFLRHRLSCLLELRSADDFPDASCGERWEHSQAVDRAGCRFYT